MDSFSSVRKYSVADARAAMPGMDEHGVGWLEEPFPAHDYRSYIEAKGFGRMLA
jgi:L-alanine-DL-glutamate epimerase-like enolase superfamily enzyme